MPPSFKLPNQSKNLINTPPFIRSKHYNTCTVVIQKASSRWQNNYTDRQKKTKYF